MGFGPIPFGPFNWLKRTPPQAGAQSMFFTGTIPDMVLGYNNTPVFQVIGAGIQPGNPPSPLSGQQTYVDYGLWPNVAAGIPAGSLQYMPPQLVPSSQT